MGKKARKTRWRALAVDTGNQSDSEESNHPANNKSYYNNQQYNNHHYNNHNGHHPHYNNYQQHYGGVQRSYRNGAKYATSTFASSQNNNSRGRFAYHHSSNGQYSNINETSKPQTTTTTTTNGDGKITFNEDEYTRITTPRQDVLFKKGYLSKPKTYQTQTSTGNSTISTGNSTGNGTPDHQSADGTEGTDLEYESQFVFPNGFVDQNGIYYINSFEPYPQMVVYPQMCYPPEFAPATRSKRLSTGSLTESTSPHNEETSQDLSHSGGETANYADYPPNHVYNVVFPAGYFYGNGVPPEMEMGHGEPRKIKKRRRRKLSKPVPEGNWTTSSSDEYDESEEIMSEIENRIIQGTHRPPTADTPPQSKAKDVSTATASEEDNSTATQKEQESESGARPVAVLKADAKEFIPRSFIHHPHPHHHHHGRHPPFIANLIPLPSPFLPPPPQMHIPPPPTPQQAHVQHDRLVHEPVTTTISTPNQNVAVIPPEQEPITTCETTSVAPEDVVAQVKVEAPTEAKLVLVPANQAKDVDIAKIVSNLEEAAKDNRPKKQPQVQKSRRTFGRPLTVELNVDPKKNAITITSQRRMLPNKNYAQMLGKKDYNGKQTTGSPVRILPRVQTTTADCTNKTPNAEKTTMVAQNQVATPKVNNQWIAVHSRKKRKNNKSQEADWDEQEPTIEATQDVLVVNEDDFETYDVSKLEDVVVPPGEETSISKQPEVEDNKAMLNVPEPVTTTVVTTSVDKYEAPRKSSKDAKTSVSEEEEFDKLIKTLEELEAKTPNKKKPLKATTKRVIITDVDVEGFNAQTINSPSPAVVTPKVKEVGKKSKGKPAKETVIKQVSQEVVKEVVKEKEKEVVVEEIIVQDNNKDVVAVAEVEKKKDLPKEVVKTIVESIEVVSEEAPQVEKIPVVISTKKVQELVCKFEGKPVPPPITTPKKKPEEHKVEIVAEPKAATAVQHKIPIEEIEEEKEVTEIDKLSISEVSKSESETPEKKRKKKKKPTKKLSISEAHFSDLVLPVSANDETSYDFLLTDSLLEDERTNVEISEELDKIIQRGMYSSLEEKIKSLNITAANDGFFKSLSLVPPTTASKKSKEDDLNSILTNTTNIFKGKRTLCHHQMQNEPSTTGSFLDIANIQQDPGIDESKAYPITQAVKNWMVRTRETTPEVELLKSPKTILKEMTLTNGGVDIASKPSGTVLQLEEPLETIPLKESWSLTPESSFDDDLLECWDDLEDTSKIAGATVAEDEIATDAQAQEVEALEVYESMYGKNEDYKQIKADIEEKRRNGTLPKHGNLPYRAICCSVV